MKVPIKWLKEYVRLVDSPAEIAGKLTMAGIEAGETQDIGGGWDNIVVGQIIAINPHPNADRLSLPLVDLGAEQQAVVCGASNLTEGDKVAFARVGAEIIDGYSGERVRLEPVKIRGVASSGMLCSEKELGISDNHEEILILPPSAPVGRPLAEYMGDVVIDLDVTPNRPDCLSVIGIAREVAALTGQKVTLPGSAYPEGSATIAEKVAIEIDAPDLCPRYSASLITGIEIGESPQWMQQRLLACGMRPINNIVDITNYVMLEYGQPLHAFDYNVIKGQKIIVRRARPGEFMLTLDGVERNLTGDMLVISDAERAVALAGMMGGEDSEVTAGTTSILLESANFNPASIHFTSRSLLLTSEASMRYERGASPDITIEALGRATQLMVELAGGEAARGIIDVYPGKKEHQPIRLTTEEAAGILGVDFGREQIAGALSALGFACQVSNEEIWATAPYWRSDISIPYDLVEEVARIIGYDQIPLTLLSRPLPHQERNTDLSIKRSIGQGLVGYGFQEVVTPSLTSRESLERVYTQTGDIGAGLVRMDNPMTVDQEYLRSNLRSNLLAALAANRRHEEGAIRLFEMGRIYLPHGADLPEQPAVVCGVMNGPRWERSWHGPDEMVDFYDAKGVVEGLLGRLGLTADYQKGADGGLHPGKQAVVKIEGMDVGVVGELHPKVALAWELALPTYLFEFYLEALLPLASRYEMYRPVPRYPAVVRDIALIVDEGIGHRQVADIIGEYSLVGQVSIFDIYSGGQVPSGKKSLAYRITFQSPEHTLTDAEADAVQQQILDKLARELGATLRS